MTFPLLFTYRGITIGPGFVARIDLRGRGLAVVEPDSTWIYGVTPGGLAEGGHSLDEAHRHFRETLRLVFADIAEESTSFHDFRAKATAFFNETNRETAAAWDTAVERVRASANATLGDLPTWPAESRVYVSITLQAESSLTPRLNTIESEAAVAIRALAA